MVSASHFNFIKIFREAKLPYFFYLLSHILFNSVRQKGHCARAFHGFGNHSLVLGAIAGPARRNDLGLRIHELSHKQSVLIINGVDVIGAEIARFFHWLKLLFHNNMSVKLLLALLLRTVCLRSSLHPYLHRFG